MRQQARQTINKLITSWSDIGNLRDQQLVESGEECSPDSIWWQCEDDSGGEEEESTRTQQRNKRWKVKKEEWCVAFTEELK